MKFNDDITQSIASTVKNVLEGKATKEEVKYPHDMFHPETGKKEVAKTPEDHEKLAKQGYTHEKPKLDEVEQPKAKGEKDFKKMHDDNVEVSGESPDGEVTKAKKGNYYKEEVDEESEKQAKYKKFFNAALKKFGVSSPAELEGDKKKEFFDYVDKNYEAKDEEKDIEEKTVSEASLKIKTDLDDYPVTKQGKKLRLKVKEMPGKGDNMYGPDAAVLTGREQDIIKYAKMYLGFDGSSFKELKKMEKDGDI